MGSSDTTGNNAGRKVKYKFAVKLSADKYWFISSKAKTFSIPICRVGTGLIEATHRSSPVHQVKLYNESINRLPPVRAGCQ